MLLKKKLLLHFLFLLTAITVTAQQAGSNLVLYSLTEKDGLTDNSITCFLQDSRGVMWMGSNYGLNAFDGSVIKQYHHSTNGNSIASEAVNDIKEDAQQNLWLATGNGLCSFSLTNRLFTTYHFDEKTEALNRYYSLSVNDHIILLATEDGLELFNTDTKKFTLYKNNTAGNGNNRITKIFTDSKKRTWLCTYNGLWLFNVADKSFTSYDNESNDALFDGLVNDIFEDHLGKLWFGTWSKGLKLLDPQTKNITPFLQYTGSSTNLAGIAEQKTAAGYTLWVSSNLARLDEPSRSFIPLAQNNSHATALGAATHLYCDRNGLLWIATEEGIKIYNPAKQYFSTTILSSFVPLTSQGIALLPLKNKLLLGGEGGTALLLFNNTLQQQQNLSAQIEQGAAVMHIQQDNNGNFWCCTSNGLVLLDSSLQRKKRFVHDDKNPASLPKNFLNSTLLKKNGEVWIMPWRKGIWRMDRTTQQFHPVITIKNDTLLAGANISKAIEDANGNTWITDYTGGLFKYNPQTGSIENIIPAHRFTNEYIRGNTLWTVAAAEIFSVDVSTGKTTVFLLPDGKNKYEYDFIPDSNGHLWIATKNGLLCFDTSTKNFRQYTESDGLYNDVLDINFAQLDNGNIIMAGGTYITSFNPSIALQNKITAPLLFTGAASNGIEKPGGSSILEFDWDEKNISLNWALLNYSNPLGNIYYYKLDGVDKDWQQSGNKGIAVFNSLEPGQYQFHYKAATAGGVMSEEKTCTLIIHPPFWKTWWFRLTALLALGFLFYSIVRYISQRNLKEKVLTLEKEQAIEKERNRISRDMHDELGSGLTKIAILTEVIKTQQQSNEQIEKISTTARELVDNLDEMVWALNPQNDSLDKLAAYIAEYANQFMEGTGIDCMIELPDDIAPLHIGEEKRRNIFMVVKEFLNNTVKHSNAKKIAVQLQQQGNAFSFVLKDDGKGFDAAQTGSNGNGLKNMQQRIADAGGHAVITSSANGTTLSISFH